MGWDAMHYDDIRRNGYFFHPDFQSTVAFFPVFPYAWKVSGLDVYGISVFNAIVFFLSVFVFVKSLGGDKKIVLMVLALPSLFFFFLPYSEALFFLTSVILLVGIEKKKLWMACLGFFLCCISRSAANVFIPAILIMQFLSGPMKETWKNMLSYTGSALAGIFVVALFQYSQVGVFWGFMQTQKHWYHKLQVPQLPYNTWGDVLQLDTSALFSGLIAGALIIYFLYQRMVENRYYTDNAYIFSILYVAGVTTVAVLFKGNSIYSLNRYVFPTAFFFLFFIRILPVVRHSTKALWRYLAAFFAGWVLVKGFKHLFSFFFHIKEFLSFSGFVSAWLAILFINHPNKYVRMAAFWGFYGGCLLAQMIYFNHFLQCEWVG
ncbi:MAG: hypothetical protein M3Q97_05135 [Bacteroidota bacterium]|nr:hypothetical protein [Bacteroidota bacterium]